MSHPVLVDVIENRFVPGLIYNNKKEDAAKLGQFKEPSWNNPVVRFLNHDLKDVIARKDGIWTTSGVAARMTEALNAAKRKVPICLELVRLEHSKQTEYATFAMHCYWEGEIQLGQLAGVKQTQSAWYNKKEIVNVSFDPALTSYEEIVKRALKVRCASSIFTRSEKQNEIAKRIAGDRVESIDAKEFGKPAKKSDQKYYLKALPLQYVPMTETQKVRINSALGRRANPLIYLNEEQKRMAIWIEKNIVDKSLTKELTKAHASKDLGGYFNFVRQRMR